MPGVGSWCHSLSHSLSCPGRKQSVALLAGYATHCIFVVCSEQATKLLRGDEADCSRKKAKVDNPRTAIWRVVNDLKGVDVTRAPVAEMTPDEGVI